MTDQIPPPWMPRVDEKAKVAQLRCPACGKIVTLPAWNCPYCRINFKTGLRPARRWPNLLKKMVRKTIRLGFYLGLAFLIYQATLNNDPGRPTPAATEVLKVVKGAPDSFSRLAAQYPILLRPYTIIYETRAAISESNDRFNSRQKVLDALFQMDQSLESEGGASSQQMTPGQRARALKELYLLLSQSPESEGDYLSRKMTPAQREQALTELEQQNR